MKRFLLVKRKYDGRKSLFSCVAENALNIFQRNIYIVYTAHDARTCEK